MSKDDQRYRRSAEKLSHHYPNTFDSLILAKRLTKTEFCSLTEQEQEALKRQAFQLARRKLKPLMAQNDSLRAIQQKLDEKNTEKLIEITKKHGWLTAQGIGCKERFITAVIFRHAPKKYWNEIKVLIDKERREKRLSGYEHYLIDNHLKGRPPMTKKPRDFLD